MGNLLRSFFHIFCKYIENFIAVLRFLLEFQIIWPNALPTTFANKLLTNHSQNTQPPTKKILYAPWNFIMTAIEKPTRVLTLFKVCEWRRRIKFSVWNEIYLIKRFRVKVTFSGKGWLLMAMTLGSPQRIPRKDESEATLLCNDSELLSTCFEY